MHLPKIKVLENMQVVEGGEECEGDEGRDGSRFQG